ncbi:hypothetical protein AAVH_33049 [Aphelenchoides avenae]|nr:hypothetical protein AAVH_33049 [Aphelenchus avenae]
MLEVLRWLKRFDLDGKQITTRRLRSLVENNQMPLRKVDGVDYEGNVLTPDPRQMNMLSISLGKGRRAEVKFRIETAADVQKAVAYLSSCFVAEFNVFAHHGVPPKYPIIAAPKLIRELGFRFCDFLDNGEEHTLNEMLNGSTFHSLAFGNFYIPGCQIDDKWLESLRLRGCNYVNVGQNTEDESDEKFAVTEEGILSYCFTLDEHLPVPDVRFLRICSVNLTPAFFTKLVEASKSSQQTCNVELRLESLRFDVSNLDVGVLPSRSSEHDDFADGWHNVHYNIADYGNGVRLSMHFNSEDGEEWHVTVRHGANDDNKFFDDDWY